MKVVEKHVTYDLRFDCSEDELDFWFDDANAKYLYVYVCDHLDLDDEEEG